MFESEPVVRGAHAERRLKARNASRTVLLVEGEPPVDQPVRRIVVREKDVVHVHPDAGLQSRQNLEEFAAHIAAEFAAWLESMKRMSFGLQLVERVERHALHLLLDQVIAGMSFVSRGCGKGSMQTSSPRCPSARLCSNARGDARGHARADFDDARRPQVANERVIHRGVEAPEVLVREIKRSGPRLLRLVAISIAEPPYQPALSLEIEIDRIRNAAPRRVVGSDAAEIWQRLVVVDRPDVISPRIRQRRPLFRRNIMCLASDRGTALAAQQQPIAPRRRGSQPRVATADRSADWKIASAVAAENS